MADFVPAPPSEGSPPRPLLWHRGLFWLGAHAIILGVVFHLPDFVAAAEHDYRMAGMPMGGIMLWGMVLIVAGILAAGFSMVAGAKHARRTAVAEEELKKYRLIQGDRIRPAHLTLLVVLCVALVVDVMKPATLGFVVPGMKDEYGISNSKVSLLPPAAMIGTTCGSILWGLLADLLGRRQSILLASLIFIGTAICGAMPSFSWNVFMCFIMGLSAGGMLPIVFALLAELMPTKHRGWLAVLLGSLGTTGGYLVASGAAALLEPIFGWRILWLLGLPSGFSVILLSRFIPESPRFLLSKGNVNEAREVLDLYDMRLVKEEEPQVEVERRRGTGLKPLFVWPYLTRTIVICSYGLAWGLVNWGFLTWLPTILRDDMGVAATVTNNALAEAALWAMPAGVVVAWLYGAWSTKKTLLLFILGTAAALVVFAVAAPLIAENQRLLVFLMIAVLMGLNGMIAMLSPYSAELYPTHLRATGAGLAASSSKLGGIFGPPLVSIVVVLFHSLRAAALSVVLPLLIAATLLFLRGLESRGRRLDDI